MALFDFVFCKSDRDCLPKKIVLFCRVLLKFLSMLTSIYHIAINELWVYLRNRSRERWRKFDADGV